MARPFPAATVARAEATSRDICRYEKIPRGGRRPRLFDCWLAPMNRARLKKFVVPMLSMLAMAGGLLALLAVPGLRPADILARRWERELQTVPDDQALAHLRKVAQLGDAGNGVLIQALSSSRDSVTEAARIALVEQLDRWQLLRARESSPKVAALARQLRDQVDRLGPGARRAAADLGLRILLWPVDSDSVDRTQLIADCETIMRVSVSEMAPLTNLSEPEARTQRVARAGSATAGTLRSSSPGGGQLTDEVSVQRVLQRVLDLPGAELPIDVVEVPDLPPARSLQERPARSHPEPPKRSTPPPAETSATDSKPPGILSPPLAGKISTPTPPQENTQELLKRIRQLELQQRDPNVHRESRQILKRRW